MIVNINYKNFTNIAYFGPLSLFRGAGNETMRFLTCPSFQFESKLSMEISTMAIHLAMWSMEVLPGIRKENKTPSLSNVMKLQRS